MDVQTFSIGLGLVVSLLFTEVFGLASGGMIVPGYIALSLDKPLDIALTLAVALATYGAVLGISQFAIIYGRRRIALTLLVGFVIGSVVRTAFPYAGALPPAAATTDAMVSVIGYIVPGLIALWIDRQGLIETVGPLMTSSVIVRLVLILVGMEMVA
jgi:poly-gamma-glutamate biosynthesis protein PgsC/CapC